MKLEFSKTALSDLAFWKKADRKAAQKVTALLLEILETPYAGKGKPEQLVGNLSGYWSRRINTKDRIIYSVDEETATIFIRSLRKHYE
ncbi:Txe/YoeB family addiction module toxin [Akkermansia sp. N21169]|jgi:toxin YoeB|uniref:Txe/YoeB family addiction module toxin n=1 Tax=unclassified Akkermansia TaxID=2608915 RepID=UPI00244E6508|nr:MULTISPECIES: Txe/YoeB family addiction module toxin [unclassified Akkermansia]MDH3068799.1 Txe/YoeB family addiction module toxin [Akkermansia sp. N21169]WPX40156.1 Txe/YoeB family addiction module toxin [Akkermansia sp. N21116]